HALVRLLLAYSLSSDSLSYKLHPISIAQFFHPGYRRRLATAEAFYHVVEVAGGFAQTDDALLNAVPFDQKNKIGAVTVHHRGLWNHYPRRGLPVFRCRSGVGEKIDARIHLGTQLLI